MATHCAVIACHKTVLLTTSLLAAWRAGVALGFFGLETVLEGWLILRSTFLPRWLGALTIIAGAGWLAFLSPTLGYAVFNVIALVALIGSIATIGWLLVKGVDEERWWLAEGDA